MDVSEKIQNLPVLGANFQTRDTAPYESHLYRDFLKRVFDILFAIVLLPFILPVLLVLMVLIKLDSKGPAVFASERVGKDGVKFKCLKLRTMCLNADKKLEDLLESQLELRSEFSKHHKLKNDPRITRVGKLLRSSSLDELPQIFNVLRGEMSFVGPRPVNEEEVRKYGNSSKHYKSVLPGITGMWQVSGRSDLTFDQRVNLDVFYKNNLNILLDLKIIAKTLPATLKRSGAY